MNQRAEQIFNDFVNDYQAFWEVSGSDKTETINGVEVTTFVGGGSRHSVEEMQAVLDIIGTAGFLAVATAAANQIAYIEGNGGSVPDRYKSSAFEYTIGQSGIKLTKLADAWVVPPEKE
jgi:hypothetical protein